jgi:hypothetical protein
MTTTVRSGLLTLATLVCLVGSPPLIAWGAEEPPGNVGSTAGPLEVVAQSLVEPGPTGIVVENFMFLFNEGQEPVRVAFFTELVWPNGERERGPAGHATVGAGDLLAAVAISRVPDGAGPGTGSFTLLARVDRIGPGPGTSFDGPVFLRDDSTFLLR